MGYQALSYCDAVPRPVRVASADMSTEMITSQLRTALQTMSPKEYSDMLRGRVLAETDRTVHKQLLAGPNQLKALPKPHVSRFAPQKSSRTDQDA